MMSDFRIMAYRKIIILFFNLILLTERFYFQNLIQRFANYCQSSFNSIYIHN